MISRLEKIRLWLTPGMKVKRHISLAILGTVCLMIGASFLVLWLFQVSLSKSIPKILTNPVWAYGGVYISLFFLSLGIGLVVHAVRALNYSLLSSWTPRPRDTVIVTHKRLSLSKGPRIVALGGGTGLSNLLRGLRHHTSNITAVVAVSDDGGSSGRLRSAFNIPPPGDLVDCLAALSDNELHVSKLLKYRFHRGNELKGHTFGNLFITTLTEVEGDFAEAIRLMNALLNICGVVYPVSAQAITLKAKKYTGKWVTGESLIRKVAGPIEKVTIEPYNPPLVPEVASAIALADVIVLGPGSLFSSTLPPLLVPECKQALLETNAPIGYICNVMTEAGETDGYSAWHHVKVIKAHIGRYPDWVLINNAPIDSSRLQAYRAEHSEVVTFDSSPFLLQGVEVIHADILSKGLYAQHDSQKLVSWLINYIKGNAKITGIAG